MYMLVYLIRFALSPVYASTFFFFLRLIQPFLITLIQELQVQWRVKEAEMLKCVSI